jgi:hypothetical protein
MSTFDGDDGKSVAASSFLPSRSCSRSGTPASSAASKTSKGSNKVTERHFTPRTRRLAIASKAHVRTRVVYHPNGPFNPVNGRMARMDFAWTTVKETAANSDDPQITDAFKRASRNDATKKNLLTFVSHLSSNEW